MVTNSHIVKDAVSIKVRLNDDQLLKAEVIGIDQKTDLAVLKLLTTELLPTAASQPILHTLSPE